MTPWVGRFRGSRAGETVCPTVGVERRVGGDEGLLPPSRFGRLSVRTSAKPHSCFAAASLCSEVVLSHQRHNATGGCGWAQAQVSFLGMQLGSFTGSGRHSPCKTLDHRQFAIPGDGVRTSSHGAPAGNNGRSIEPNVARGIEKGIFLREPGRGSYLSTVLLPVPKMETVP